MTSSDTDNVWWELRLARGACGPGEARISLTKLAKIVPPPAEDPRKKDPGMSLGYLSDLENGRREPSAAITRRLAAALGVPVHALAKSDPRQQRADAA